VWLKSSRSQQQADGSFVEVCPNKDKAGFCAAANVKIADIRTKHKARKDKSKKSKKTKASNAALDKLSEDQKVLCIEEATCHSSTSTLSASTGS
jgi:23S rRNA pseudoU1915 N3-methylase RlmH